MQSETVRQAYGSIAGLYIDLFGTTRKMNPEDPAFIGRHLAGHLGPVLDLGCGPGHLTGYLRSLGLDVRGIDLVPEFVTHARAAYPDVEFHLGSFEHLDVATGSVDGILAWYSLIHLPPEEFDGVLGEFRRAMAPGGRLVLGFFDADEVGPFAHKVVTAYRWPPDEVSERLRRAGFREVERVQRPREGSQRPHAAMAAVAE
ncbi:methyltransferase domain-containing protein [Micromonospora sp. NPDC048905]|uniref:methyltransferase domain-containing protein n=1 Tax=unclassified Micromonospora TaxID=2617518 RepID=UPI0033E482C6